MARTNLRRGLSSRRGFLHPMRAGKAWPSSYGPHARSAPTLPPPLARADAEAGYAHHQGVLGHRKRHQRELSENLCIELESTRSPNSGAAKGWVGRRAIGAPAPKPRAILKIEVARRASRRNASELPRRHEAAGRLTRDPPRPSDIRICASQSLSAGGRGAPRELTSCPFWTLWRTARIRRTV